MVTDHDSTYQRDGQFANEWSRDNCTVEDGPTDAYGSISFDNERISQVINWTRRYSLFDLKSKKFLLIQSMSDCTIKQTWTRFLHFCLINRFGI